MRARDGRLRVLVSEELMHTEPLLDEKDILNFFQELSVAILLKHNLIYHHSNM